MPLLKILPVRAPSRGASLGLALVLFASLLGTNGCISYDLTGIYVEPSGGACVYPGFTAQFTAYGTYTEGGHAMVTKNITDQASWKIDLPNLATVNSSGLVTTTGAAIGLTDVIASAQGEFGTVFSSAPLTVETDCVSSSGAVRTLSSIHILPQNQTLQSVGDTSELVAVGRFAIAPFSSDLTRQVAWESSNPRVATVSASGLLTAVGAGEATITARRTLSSGAIVTATEKVQVGSQSPQP